MWDCRYPKDPTIIFCPPLDQMTKISKNLSKKDTYNIIKKDEKNIPFWSSTAYQINKPFQINKPLHEEPLQKEPLRWLWAHKIMKPLHIIKKPLHIINNIKLDNEINKIISLPECLIIIKESIFIYNWTFYAPKMSIIFSEDFEIPPVPQGGLPMKLPSRQSASLVLASKSSNLISVLDF
eukprot:GHVL01035151.1.p1 GENE.GHVL01035151.1~~GHVL01035151.1.p1  ORF type:complete len:180 (-),score=65.05 GHVL01035151.1:32-571(-)